MADDTDRDARVREAAFLLWNADGRPDGQADAYWFKAEKVIEHQDALADEKDRRGEL